MFAKGRFFLHCHLSASKMTTNKDFLLNRSNCWKPRYEVLDQNHRQILLIKGPCCFCRGNCCGCDKTFSVSSVLWFSVTPQAKTGTLIVIIFSKITGVDGKYEIGAIRKQWTGYVRNLFTNAECFSLTCNVFFFNQKQTPAQKKLLDANPGLSSIF